ncbi:hypothetical protein Patl1_29065 [Pistacia atlantica]|uniref:Uncharacterized protein n=1 Tax=Pistacia atlantica TaxID=434234 RepID=A0ACC1BCF2_9ROSI|nr:hypothetical protein Patl1_29065 [Pistacia atlantica]
MLGKLIQNPHSIYAIKVAVILLSTSSSTLITVFGEIFCFTAFMTAEAEAKPLEKMATRERRPRPTKEKPNPPKEKKPNPPKEKKPKAVSHPPYFEMIKEALLALKDKSGSSPRAIGKYIEEKHKSVLPANFKKMLGVQLKNSAAKGKLIKIRASYMLAEGVVPKEKSV